MGFYEILDQVGGEVGGGTRQEQLALGEPPNLAARLQGIAAPNTMLISASTLQLLSGFFTYHALGISLLKGLAQPVEVYQVLHESTARSRLEAAGSTGLTPLVGREQEVALLSGEAGIGKSRLVQVLKEQVAAEPQAWLTPCQCSPYHQNTALYPWIDLLERIALRFEREDASQQKREDASQQKREDASQQKREDASQQKREDASQQKQKTLQVLLTILLGPLAPLAIPTTLHDSLMARLDRLATVKALAQLGATLGREFSYALLQAVSPWDEGTLRTIRHSTALRGSLPARYDPATLHRPPMRLTEPQTMAHCASDAMPPLPRRKLAMTRVGAGKYTYELIQDFPKLPAGESLGIVSTVATDSQDRVYVFQRKDPPVMVFDRDGNYLNCWGIGAITDPHGMTIVDDIVYITDRSDSVAVTFTLDGKPLQVLGKRGVHSDTGCDKPGDLVPRAAGPFNYPTEIVPSPSGDLYVSDGYRNARVHRFTRDGQLINSWGQPGKTAPGQFHLPHSVLVAPDGKVYVCDRANRRVQIFSADGEFISMWTGMGGPNDIARDKDGVFYICEQEADGTPPFVSIRDGDGAVLARWEIRHAHGLWVDSHGDIYLGLTTNHSVDKYVRVA